MRALILASLIASPAVAQDTKVYPSGNRMEPISQVTIRPTREAGGVAEVVFKNEDHVHSFPSDTFNLISEQGIEVEVTLIIDLSPDGPDKMTVVAPDGYFAVPYEVIVNEGAVGTIIIYTMETPSS